MIMGWLLATMGSPASPAPLAPAISNVTATRVSNGTGCGATLGTRYTTTWTPNASVTDGAHDVKVTLSGGAPTVTATRAQAQSIPSVDVTSYEANDSGGSPLTYTLTYELIDTSGPTVLQSGTVSGIPTSNIYNIDTSCAV